MLDVICLFVNNELTLHQIRTHFQVLIEEAELPEALQVVVLLPAAVQTLGVAPCLPAAPPVHQPPEGHKRATERSASCSQQY